MDQPICPSHDIFRYLDRFYKPSDYFVEPRLYIQIPVHLGWLFRPGVQMRCVHKLQQIYWMVLYHSFEYLDSVTVAADFSRMLQLINVAIDGLPRNVQDASRVADPHRWIDAKCV